MEKILFKISGFLISIILLTTACSPPTNWDLANENKDLLRVSTIFTAHDVRDKLSYKDGLDSAIMWCKNAGVTRVFIETFRGYTAERETLLHAKEQFEQANVPLVNPILKQFASPKFDPSHSSPVSTILFPHTTDA